jgi:hypothetical protein
MEKVKKSKRVRGLMGNHIDTKHFDFPLIHRDSYQR